MKYREFQDIKTQQLLTPLSVTVCKICAMMKCLSFAILLIKDIALHLDGVVEESLSFRVLDF